MRFILTFAGALALAMPALATPALAQARDPSAHELDDLAQAFGDPARQQELARSLETLSDVLLDLPLAPIAAPLAEAAGEDPHSIDPDLTLRQMAPDASAVPGTIRQQLPQAMDRAARMSEALSRLAPALRQMTLQLQDALPTDGRR